MFENIVQCVMGPQGGRCSHGLCRACCKVKCYTQGLDCPGHRILVKTKREKAAIYYAQQEALKKEQEGKEGEATDENAGEKLVSSPPPEDQRQEHQTTDSPSQQEPPPPLTAEAEARESGKTDEPLGPEGVAAEESIGTLLQEAPNGLPDDSPPLTGAEKDSQDSGLAKPVT
ncbi:tRNA-dihydrouridine(16/17) synthase [NAD(P)(+)]-like [Portunus trituberculatus]|uniref:tRNA-dihydrouridine(16/17) synthase [NAD(P)(+)]-like n=1 Tax=Portunus trituberculatus TaxID=210409 RepID=A0A5B7GAR0_PORTR|nr:tRNA-dihydrouridine(16/17) synthase [NAD(P)(+)]-like [Portunus trituberculatus]